MNKVTLAGLQEIKIETKDKGVTAIDDVLKEEKALPIKFVLN